jgi:hypothetical protein
MRPRPAILTGMSIDGRANSGAVRRSRESGAMGPPPVRAARRGANDLAHTPVLLLMFVVAVAARFHGAQVLPVIRRSIDTLFGGPTLACLPHALHPMTGTLPLALAAAALMAIAMLFARMLASVLSRAANSRQLSHN